MSVLSVANTDQYETSEDINEENCPICLGFPQNQAIPDCCKHVFCTNCILEWQKISQISKCPLCNNNFSDIQSTKRYEDPARYPVGRPFLLLPPYSLKKDLVYHFGLGDFCFSRNKLFHARKKAAFRTKLYQESKYVLTPSVMGSDGSSKIYPDNLENKEEVIRDLRRWIHRELKALLNKKVTEETVDIFIRVLMSVHPLCVPFENQLRTILGHQTSHFIHELYNYMISPFNIIEYDSYAAFGPLEIVSSLGLTITHNRETLPQEVVEGDKDLKDFLKQEIHFNKFKQYFMVEETLKECKISKEEYENQLISKTQKFVIHLKDEYPFGPNRRSTPIAARRLHNRVEEPGSSMRLSGK